MALFSVPLCRDCRDLQLEVKATRMIGRTPVCDEHMRQRLGEPATRGIALAAPARPVILGMAAVEKAKEEKAMRKQTDVAVQIAIRRDAAAGMSLGDIAKKHKVSWPTAKRYAGGGHPKSSAAARRGRAAKPANGGVTLAATPELCDGIWAALPLEKKAALLNRLQELN